jgi:cation diffusion facilitator family transporter
MTEKEREQGIYKVTIIGSIVNFVLVAFKFLAGIFGNSSAMIADAVHSLSDFITDIIVIFFVRISNKPKDKTHDYGHGKFETFATLLIGFVLLLVGFGIAYSGVSAIISVICGETLASPGMFALIAAIISIIFKELLYHYTIVSGRKLKSDAVIANAWHHRSDAFSSIATVLGIGGALLFGNKWTILDPIAATIVSFFVVKVAFKLIRPSLDELMEKSLPEDIEDEIKLIVESYEDVSDLHNLRTRKLGNNYAIEFHIRMEGQISLEVAHERVTKIEKRLKEHYGANTHVIIHIEPLKIITN